MGLCLLGVRVNRDDTSDEKTYIMSESFRHSLKKEEEIPYKRDDLEIVFTAFSISYGTYNQLRDLIREVIGNSDELDYLLNFSDCDGFIGPSAVKKMAEFLKVHGPSLTLEIKQKVAKDYGEDELDIDEEDKESVFFYNCAKGLCDCIVKTAQFDNGYLMFC